MVARQHHDVEPHAAQPRDSRLRAGPDRVRRGDDAGHTAVDGDIHRRLALLRQLLASVPEAIEREAQALHHPHVAQRHALAFDHGLDALPGQRFELVGVGQVKLRVAGRSNDRLAERVLRAALDGGRQPQQLQLVDAVSLSRCR